jgi:hypothetical protein
MGLPNVTIGLAIDTMVKAIVTIGMATGTMAKAIVTIGKPIGTMAKAIVTIGKATVPIGLAIGTKGLKSLYFTIIFMIWLMPCRHLLQALKKSNIANTAKHKKNRQHGLLPVFFHSGILV